MFDESGGVFRHWISFVGSEYEETLVSLSSRQEHQEQSVKNIKPNTRFSTDLNIRVQI
ncbi:hypothetical protein HanRHA438_Chr00c01g0842781 [Helianthus annuus]|nr:hypothetical protein HanRHA438_Chr00c01g0842781 [Helianthus annuus]